MPFVIDASVAMAWCFDDEATPQTDAILDRLLIDHAVVPALWNLEVANVVLSAQRRRRIAEAQAERFLALLRELPIVVDVAPVLPVELFAAGSRHGLTAYDAHYLLVAERLAVPLATLDAKLAAAATAAGVALLIDG